MKSRPALTVIPGNWVSCPGWLDFPDSIEARSPIFGLDVCKLRVSKADVEKAAGVRRRVPAYLLWSALFGVAPPVPHKLGEDADLGLTRLTDAHACFQGLGRPCGSDENGASFVAFALKPKWVIEPRPMPPVMLAAKVAIPDDVVFMAYARLDNPARQNGNAGVLTHWNFVPADRKNLLLPAGHRKRYLRRLW